MAKPTENLDWATNGTATEILEPTAGQRTQGVQEGSTWTRRRLNWMFNGLGKWITYLRDNVSELGTEDDQARNNLQNDQRFIVGRSGTEDDEFRTNIQNDGRFQGIIPDTSGFSKASTTLTNLDPGDTFINFSALTEGTDLRIGGTGSGQTVWDALDNLPTNTKSITVRLAVINITTVVGADLFIWASPTLADLQGAGRLISGHDKPVSSLYRSTIEATIPLTDNEFYLRWSETSGAGYNISMYLISANI